MTHGRITIITGSPGTGKSTVADKAAMESDMEKSVCIRTDDFFHYLKKGAIPPHLPESNAQNGVVVMQQGLQVVLVGHRNGFVCRIHPLHRQLQRLPTAHSAHGRGGGEHFLGLDGGRGKEGIFGAGGEIGEVGHGEGSFRKYCNKRPLSRKLLF